MQTKKKMYSLLGFSNNILMFCCIKLKHCGASHDIVIEVFVIIEWDYISWEYV